MNALIVVRRSSFVRKLLMCMLIATPFTAASAEGKVVNLFFTGGQSNAKPGLATAISGALTASGKFGSFQMVRVNHSGAGMDLWMGWSNGGLDYQAAYKTDFFNTSGTGALQVAVKAIRDAGDTPSLGLFWFQGESDLGSTAGANAWDDKFLAMMEKIRVDMGQASPIPFGVAIIDSNQADQYALDATHLGYLAIVRASQAQLAVDHDYAVAVDTRGYTRSDLWHLTDSELSRFGANLGTAYAANVPEPMSMSILMISAGCLACRRSPRRR